MRSLLRIGWLLRLLSIASWWTIIMNICDLKVEADVVDLDRENNGLSSTVHV